jgi:hypothetical protein
MYLVGDKWLTNSNQIDKNCSIKVTLAGIAIIGDIGE